jgi:hypothetical protein
MCVLLFQEEWFLERDSYGLFSFEYICETLRLHPDYIRHSIMTKIAPWRKGRAFGQCGRLRQCKKRLGTLY